jgi:hypothetical protein
MPCLAAPGLATPGPAPPRPARPRRVRCLSHFVPRGFFPDTEFEYRGLTNAQVLCE